MIKGAPTGHPLFVSATELLRKQRLNNSEEQISYDKRNYDIETLCREEGPQRTAVILREDVGEARDRKSVV